MPGRYFFIDQEQSQKFVQHIYDLEILPKIARAFKEQFLVEIRRKSLWATTNYTHNPASQSKPKADIRFQRKRREIVCKLVTIGCGFIPDWMTKWREICKPIA